MNDGGFMAISPLNPDIVFYTGNVYNSAYFVGVSHSSDGGETWEHDTIGLGTRGWAVAFDGVDTNRVYIGGDSAYSYPCLLISTDLGTTWTMSRVGLSGAVYALLTIPGDGQRIHAGTTNGVFISTDAGVTWEATTLNRSVKTLVFDPANQQNIFAGTYGYGVYASTDGGITWDQMNDGLTCNKVLTLALRSGTENSLFAGTEGGSVFKTTVATGVAGPSSPVPRPSSLGVSPNPCRNIATLRINSSLLSPHSSLCLYDASGRLVRTIPVATSSIELRTSGLKPGAYFVRLKSGTKTHTSRIQILH